MSALGSSARRAPLALCIALALAPPAQAVPTIATVGLESFAKSARGDVVPVLIELREPAAFVEARAKRYADGKAMREAAQTHHARVRAAQDAFIAAAAADGLAILPRVAQHGIGKRATRIAYRLSYTTNGFIAFVAAADLAPLRARPEVRALTRIEDTRFLLDQSVNYLLGAQPVVAARRLAVYGATEELDPSGTNGNGPRETPVDGLEGQGIHVGVVDSGLDYEHPMFGGSGASSPAPQRLPDFAPTQNQKVPYFYNLGGAATLDDFGHGTHVASTIGGYVVDGNTPMVTPTGSVPFGPTPGGVRMHGVAPQVKLMGWPVCNISSQCPGDIELAIEDAVSPVVLTGTGDGGSTVFPGAIAKPVADVVNLSLGGGNDPAASTSRASNNAVFATGAVVVAAAGNDGPAASTVGAPCVGAMVICAASVHDPGSTAGSDVLAAGETANDGCADTNGACVLPAPAAETGASSEANATAPGERAGLRSYRVAGGGELPQGSVSAHYVYVDRDQPTVPSNVTGRIALLDGGTGAFATIINPVASLNPAAILLISDVTSATAVQVVNGVPTFTIGVADGEYLKAEMRGGGGAPAHGAVSVLPLRVRASINLPDFTGAVSDFSSRGPNAHVNADYRVIKPDVAGLGQAVLAATTPTGNVDAGIGMANASGYTVANGTSMASPHVAGAAALVRQRLRAMGFDNTDPADPDYRAERFNVATMVRAILTNTATDLRTGVGGDDPDAPNPPYTIQDVGGGLVDVDAALRADAYMTSPTTVFEAVPDEYTVPANGAFPVPVDDAGNAIVPLPTASFGNVAAAGALRPVVRERVVTIRDFTGKGGSYALAFVDDVGAFHPDLALDLRSADGSAAITAIAVPPNGEASFRVRVSIDGTGALTDGTIATWYLTATHESDGERLRMPFLLRVVSVPVPQLGLPSAPTIGDAGPENGEGCAVDTDNAFTVNWTYTPDEDALAPSGYLLQRGTYERVIFTDDAGEALVGGANSRWSGSPQWGSQANPDTTSPSYFIPDTTSQAEALTLDAPVSLGGAIGASLRITTRVDTEAGFDYASVLANRDGGGYQPLARWSGVFSGTVNLDLAGFLGSDVGLQLMMSSDLAVPGVGWWVDQIDVLADDFTTRATLGAAVTSSAQSVFYPGSYRFRVRGTYDVDGTPVRGPATDSACACVPLASFPNLPQDLVFLHGMEDAGGAVGTNCQ